MSTPGDQIGWGLDYIKETYPGSNTPVQTYEERHSAEPTTDKAELGKPRIYPVKGVPTEFFTVGQVAALLGRKANTIRDWETKGVIPKARYTRPGRQGDTRGNRRLYTRAQAEGMLAIAEEEGIMDLRAAISQTQFTSKVIKLFRELEGQ